MTMNPSVPTKSVSELVKPPSPTFPGPCRTSRRDGCEGLHLPDLRQRFFENGVAAARQTPEEFAKFIAADCAKWKKVVEVSGAKAQ